MNAIPWDSGQAIYRQLRDRFVAKILEGEPGEGQALPSVRQVASEFALNPITVLRAYRQLVDEHLIEKRRGLGMFVSAGAQAALLAAERRRFLECEWPKIRATIQRLQLSAGELLQGALAEPGAAGSRTGVELR
jgi:GntR family transcriptional regulator